MHPKTRRNALSSTVLPQRVQTGRRGAVGSVPQQGRSRNHVADSRTARTAGTCSITISRSTGICARKTLRRSWNLPKSRAQEMLWSKPFVAIPNGKVMAGFADSRTYLHQGNVVDRQTHLGYDLAVTRRAPVPAANDGIVALARYFGIYGNAVVINHGCGIMSLYGHLSNIGVTPGQKVARGDTIGQTGEPTRRRRSPPFCRHPRRTARSSSGMVGRPLDRRPHRPEAGDPDFHLPNSRFILGRGFPGCWVPGVGCSGVGEVKSINLKCRKWNSE